MATFLHYTSFIAMGVFTASQGFGLASWQFWAAMAILSIGSEAARYRRHAALD